jgi:hypothetical protein
VWECRVDYHYHDDDDNNSDSDGDSVSAGEGDGDDKKKEDTTDWYAVNRILERDRVDFANAMTKLASASLARAEGVANQAAYQAATMVNEEKLDEAQAALAAARTTLASALGLEREPSDTLVRVIHARERVPRQSAYQAYLEVYQAANRVVAAMAVPDEDVFLRDEKAQAELVAVRTKWGNTTCTTHPDLLNDAASDPIVNRTNLGGIATNYDTVKGLKRVAECAADAEMATLKTFVWQAAHPVHFYLHTTETEYIIEDVKPIARTHTITEHIAAVWCPPYDIVKEVHVGVCGGLDAYNAMKAHDTKFRDDDTGGYVRVVALFKTDDKTTAFAVHDHLTDFVAKRGRAVHHLPRGEQREPGRAPLGTFFFVVVALCIK